MSIDMVPSLPGGQTTVVSQYEDQVVQLETQRCTPGGVLLIGSSIFRFWETLTSDLAPFPVYNRAFGGSTTSEQLFFFSRLVPASFANIILWYCGSNDIAQEVPAQMIIENTVKWISSVKEFLPDSHIILCSVIRAPEKRALGKLSQVDEINAKLRTLTESKVSYVDVNQVLEEADGEPDPTCYGIDKLHLTDVGYRKLTSALRPEVARVWHENKNSPSTQWT